MGGGGPNALPICNELLTEGCATITQLALGGEHSCALASDGYVRCWGSNIEGQLGDPSLQGLSNHPPRVVPTLSQVEQIAAGEQHVCALIAKKVWCWGGNASGELGSANPSSSAQPLEVVLPPVASIASGFGTTCAVLDSGGVMCWGRLLNGQPWDGMDNSPTPTLVQGLSGMTVGKISLGNTVGCAQAQDGSEVRCWGNNSAGTLGDGTTMSRASAASVSSALFTPSVALGLGTRACAIGGSPLKLQCWGNVGSSNYAQPTELSYFPATGYNDVVAGWGHICLRDDQSAVSCFSYGYFGELGILGGNGEWIAPPVHVVGGVSQLATGWQHLCALLDSGAVQCWGRNVRGQVDPADSGEEIRSPATVVF